MSDYIPKEGDRVRATLGKNVLVGVVDGVSDELVAITPDVPRDISYSLLSLRKSEGWTFEYIINLPEKIGAIVRNDSTGCSYVLAPHDSPGSPYVWLRIFGKNSGAYVGPVSVTEGGYTVLFEGIDND